jgi:hypothetical protein
MTPCPPSGLTQPDDDPDPHDPPLWLETHETHEPDTKPPF